MQSLPVDLHLEISSLRNFINDQINSGNPFSFDAKDFYEILKRVVIDSEAKPFLTFPKDDSERHYYEKYRRQSQEEFDKLIPDFFEHEGEFYDLDRIQCIYKDFSREDDFEKLFIAKLLELQSINYPIDKFLFFQQFDNFYGQKDSIDSFLYQLTENDGNCLHLKDLCQFLRNWIDNQNLENLILSPKKSYNLEVEESIIENVDSQEIWVKEIESLKGKRLKCKWSLDQIKHYFSFLYGEKSENGEPYLKEEQVDKIFENGFCIPEKPIEPLFELNCTLKYPIKNITYAIYYFYDKANTKSHDKLGYILFFASFIKEYNMYLVSKDGYKSFSNNSNNNII